MTDCTPETTSPVRISTIYALLDADDNVRYVGITCIKMQARLRAHMNAAKHGNRTHRCNWLRSLSGPPKIVQIEQTYDRDREKFWIAYYKELGCKLTNRTDGGEGALGFKHTPEAIQKMRELRTGTKMSAETKAKISTFNKGKRVSEVTRARNSATQKGRVFSDEHRAKMSASMLKKYQDRPELRELVGQQSRARLQDPTYRANLAKAHKGCAMSADARSKISAVHKGRKFTPEHRAKISASNIGKKYSAQTLAKMSAGQKRRFSTSNDSNQGTFDFG